METIKAVNGEGALPLSNPALELFTRRAERLARSEAKLGIVPMDRLPGISYGIVNRKVVPAIRMDNSLPSCLMPPSSRRHVRFTAVTGKVYAFGPSRS